MGSNNKGFILDLQALRPEKFPFTVKFGGKDYKIAPLLSAEESFYLSGMEYMLEEISGGVPSIGEGATEEEVQAAKQATRGAFDRMKEEFQHITGILAKCFAPFHPELTGDFLFKVLSQEEIMMIAVAVLTRARGGGGEESEKAPEGEEDFPKGRGRKKGTAPSSPSSRS